MKKARGLLILLIFIMLCNIADASYSSVVITDVGWKGEYAVIKGVTASGECDRISVHVSDEEGQLVYKNEKETQEDGTFEFKFMPREETNFGKYEVIADGVDSENPTFSEFEYTKEMRTHKKHILKGDISIDITNYIPTISGNLESFEGRNCTIKLMDSSDERYVYENIISDDGMKSFSSTLPTLLQDKVYEFILETRLPDEEIMCITAEIATGGLASEISGAVAIGDKAGVKVEIQCPTIDVLNKSVIIDNNKEYSATLPNILSAFLCNIHLECDEEIFDFEDDEKKENEKLNLIYEFNISGTDNETYLIPVTNRVEMLIPFLIKIKYDTEYFEFSDVYTDLEDENKIQFKSGEIIFECSGKPGFINLVPLKALKTGKSVVSIYKY